MLISIEKYYETCINTKTTKNAYKFFSSAFGRVDSSTAGAEECSI